jgi:hypothetical protein
VSKISLAPGGSDQFQHRRRLALLRVEQFLRAAQNGEDREDLTFLPSSRPSFCVFGRKVFVGSHLLVR